MNEWRNVNTVMPTAKRNVLVTMNYDEDVCIAYINDGKWYADSNNVEVMGDAWLDSHIPDNKWGVIAWQELPQRASWSRFAK